MPKVLTESQVREFEQQGFLSPVRAMSTEQKRAKLIFEDSKIGPSVAYGGKRPAT